MNREWSFSGFFLSNPVRAWVLNIVLCVVGVVSYLKLPLRQYPKVHSTELSVEISNPGSPPSVVDSTIGRIVEEALISTPGLTQITSTTMHGMYRCVMKFDSSLLLVEALASVQQKLDSVSGDIDRSIRKPVIKFGQDDGRPLLAIALYNKKAKSAAKLSGELNKYKSQFESIMGVASAVVQGQSGGSSEYSKEVVLIPAKLEEYGVSAHECFSAVSESNFIESAGECDLGPVSIPISAVSELKTIDEIKKVVVKESNGIPITLEQVAIIKDIDPSKKIRLRHNGYPCAHMYIYAKSDSDPLYIGHATQEKIKEIRKLITDPNIEIEVYYDQTKRMEESIHRAIHSVFEAIFFVTVFILLFLGSWRAAIVPIVTLPICLLSGFFIMYACKFSINLMTLTAMILASGLVVDDAIVVIEAIESRMKNTGESSFIAALNTMEHILPSLIGMTLTLTSAYLPILFMAGITGQMFKEFAITLAGMILTSGFVAFILTPVMSTWALSYHSDQSNLITVVSQRFLSFFDYLRNKYLISLQYILRNAYNFILICSATFALSLVLGKHLKRIIVPNEDQSNIYISMQVPPKTNAQYAELLMSEIEKQISKDLDVQSISSSIFPGHHASFDIQLKLPKYRKRTADEIGADLKDSISNFTKDRIVNITTTPVTPFTKPHSQTLYLATTEISTNNLKKFSKMAVNAISKVFKSGVTHSSLEPETELIIEVDPVKAGFYGVTMTLLRRLIASIRDNPPATYIRANNKKHPLSFSINNGEIAQKESIEALKMLPIDQNSKRQNRVSGDRGFCKLGDIAKINLRDGDNVISRRDGLNVVGIDVKQDKMDEISLYETCRDQVTKILPTKGFTVMQGDAIKSLYDERGNFSFVIALASMFVYLFMAFLFESWIYPLITMLSIPLTFSGAIVGLCTIKDGSLNIWSMISILTLLALIVRIAILLVMYFNMEMKRLRGSFVVTKNLIIDAAVTSAVARFKPIMMTTVIAIVGAIPLFFGKTTGYEAFRQIATTMVGGLLIGTSISIYLIPAICVLWEESLLSDKPEGMIGSQNIEKITKKEE